MRNRKTIMTVAALLILFFHLWVPLFPNNEIGLYVRRISYIGVDMFFFLSAYSIGSRKVTEYGRFVWKRFKDVYVTFVLFAMLAFVIGNLSLSRFVKAIFGIDLLQKGGGSFLWFVPVIMLTYILLPLFHRIYEKKRVPVLVGAFVIWFLAGFMLTHLAAYKSMFIWWNRIPIILLGFIVAEFVSRNKDFKIPMENVIMPLLFVAGGILLWFFGSYKKLSVPLYDMFYVVAIPMTLGAIWLLNKLPDNIITKTIGSATLEMYAIQMVLGYRFANYMLKTVKNHLVCNLVVFAFVIGLAIVVSKCKAYIMSGLTKQSK